MVDCFPPTMREGVDCTTGEVAVSAVTVMSMEEIEDFIIMFVYVYVFVCVFVVNYRCVLMVH